MVYLYGLGKAAAGAFVRGAASSLGRRVGAYRRRRRVRWPAPRNRASNVKRSRTFVKKTRFRGGTRNVRRLWRAVKALQRTSDPDVTFRDLLPTTINISNNVDGFTMSSDINYQTAMTNNLQLGDQYKIKSFNEQLTLRMSTDLGNNQTNAPNIPVHTFGRHVRIMYILFNDERVNNIVPSLWSGFSLSGGAYVSSGDSIYPSMIQNPGLRYRVLYDKTYTVRAGTPTNIFVRIPYSVFYDKGQVKFRQNESTGTFSQQNNFLYRVMFADCITTSMAGGLSLTLGTFGNIQIVSQNRWKLYDYGRAVSSALAASVSQNNAIEVKEDTD